jgi:hypothetical protein
VQDPEYHDNAWDARWRDDRIVIAVAKRDSWSQRELRNKAGPRCTSGIASPKRTPSDESILFPNHRVGVLVDLLAGAVRLPISTRGLARDDG